MAPWTSLALLSAFVVSALSLPDERAYKIPKVGTGKRSQYYVQHDDGTFKYGHDTGEGAYETARLHHPGRQDGQYGYVDPDGNTVSLKYQAGEGGFRPVGDHIPKAHTAFYKAHSEARRRPPFKDPLADTKADASYGFNYAEGGAAREETSDADGNVRGSYSYTDEDGQTRSYSYTAGRETGFVIQGNELPRAPLTTGATPAATSLWGGASSSAIRGSTSRTSSYKPFTSSHATSTSSRRTSHPFTSSRRSGSATGFTSRTDSRPDGSYSFAYDADDQTRSETSDANLNVDGQYSFVADDGMRRTVSYEAGSGTGFLASGDHLPHPTQPSQPRRSSSSLFSSRTPSRSSAVHSSHTPSSYSTQAASRAYGASNSRFGSGFASNRKSGSNVEVANTRSKLNPDGSYAFAYETSDHSRNEAGNADTNVLGSFDFVGDDGQVRGIHYQAGANTGFIAEGAHIPVGPPVPGSPSGQPTGRIISDNKTPFVDPLADSDADASYSFAFDTDEYSRSETSDADGNVQGMYSMVDNDGTRRTYEFRAGEGIGFQTQEIPSSRKSSSRGSSSSWGSSSQGSSSWGSPSRGSSSRKPSSQKSSWGSSQAGSVAGASSFSSTGTSSSSKRTGATSRPSLPAVTTYKAGSSGGHSRRTFSQAGGSRASHKEDQYTLRHYNPSENGGKYGYVLTYDS